MKPDEDLIVPAPLKAQPYEYTVRSQKRNEHLKLRKFIKLIELMTRDTLSSIVVDSAADVCEFLDKDRQVRINVLLAPCCFPVESTCQRR